MQIFLGIVVVALSLLCWGGQTLVCFAPATGAKLGLSEREADVEPTFWADVRGEALWDFLTLWTLLVAGVLLIIGHSAWPYFGLVGGGMYVYFAGRGIFTRVTMMRRGLRIGTPQGAKVALAFLATGVSPGWSRSSPRLRPFRFREECQHGVGLSARPRCAVPFWYSAILIFIWDRDMGFRQNTLGYWVVVWGMWPAFGVFEGVYCFVRLLE